MSSAGATAPTTAVPASDIQPRVAVVAGVLIQLALALLVARLYAIENPAFFNVFALATGGFAVHALLPRRQRLPFFVALSWAGAFVVFGVRDALWLLGAGWALIGVALLPLSLRIRSISLVVIAALLAVARAGVAPVPWSAAVWPILGAMFMFRMWLFLLATKTGASQAPVPKDTIRWCWAPAYFFMLPNLVFPLYPVVDYQTFQRTYFDKDDAHIYEQGLVWISRGLVHLLLYRFVYHNVIIDAESVVTLGDLLQFMLGTFLLYLRVSGQFHLIVGLLHLFGFRLPETHKLYYLAHSFTELWRRINIYWTEFMMKAIFYPTYFKVKQRGPKGALVISTVAVFVVTWLLHSYQWFWLRGGFPITPQDTLFWGVLGGLVVAGGLRELKAGKAPKRAPGWNFKYGMDAALTFSAFCLLWSLWSTEGVGLWIWTLGAIGTIDARGLAIAIAAFGTVLLLGGLDWHGPAAPRVAWADALTGPTVRTVVPLLLLIALAQPRVQAAAPAPLVAALRAMQTTGLNASDLTRQHKGYYEQLDVRAQLDTPVSADGRKRDADWQDLAQLDVLNNDRRDLLLRDLKPSKRVTWNGHVFSTNRWGMRDEDYPVDKPAGTLRIAITGPSHVMGNNVGDGELFEAVLETRLNREFVPGSPFGRVEILNFAVDGMSLPQQLALQDDRVFRFTPDVVIATHYRDNAAMTESFLLKAYAQRIPVTDPAMAQLGAAQDLDASGREGLPVPFMWTRSLLAGMGVPARMPAAEATARSRRIADPLLVASFRRFAETTRQHGAVPAILALNVVVDDPPKEIPLRAAIDAAGLPVFDLFQVFPADRLPSLRVAPWDDHPNAAGHRVIADALYPQLVTFLNSDAVRAHAQQTAR